MVVSFLDLMSFGIQKPIIESLLVTFSGLTQTGEGSSKDSWTGSRAALGTCPAVNLDLEKERSASSIIP